MGLLTFSFPAFPGVLEPNILTLPFWPSGVPHCAFEGGEAASIVVEGCVEEGE